MEEINQNESNKKLRNAYFSKMIKKHLQNIKNSKNLNYEEIFENICRAFDLN